MAPLVDIALQFQIWLMMMNFFRFFVPYQRICTITFFAKRHMVVDEFLGLSTVAPRHMRICSDYSKGQYLPQTVITDILRIFAHNFSKRQTV